MRLTSLSLPVIFLTTAFSIPISFPQGPSNLLPRSWSDRLANSIFGPNPNETPWEALARSGHEGDDYVSEWRRIKAEGARGAAAWRAVEMREDAERKLQEARQKAQWEAEKARLKAERIEQEAEIRRQYMWNAQSRERLPKVWSLGTDHVRQMYERMKLQDDKMKLQDDKMKLRKGKMKMSPEDEKKLREEEKRLRKGKTKMTPEEEKRLREEEKRLRKGKTKMTPEEEKRLRKEEKRLRKDKLKIGG